MYKKVEKYSISVPPCRIDKEMFKPLVDLLKGFTLRCSLVSQTNDIQTDDIGLFIDSEWGSNVSTIQIKTLKSDQNVDISLNFGGKKKVASRIIVKGTDPTWVQGMGARLCSLFRKNTHWYSPIARYWQIRLLVSATLIFFIVWRSTYYFWKMNVAQLTSAFSEPQLFIILFLLSSWFSYPLSQGISWLFPYFEFADSPQKNIRKAFWFLLIALIGWVLTEFLFPRLMP